MHGFAFLVAVASLGVDYSWRTTDEGRLEYVIQIEPEFLKALADGEQIQSDVPPEAGQIQRICVRIGTKAVTHTASGKAEYKRLLVSGGRYAAAGPAVPAADAIPTIFWPGKNNPEQSFAVTYGWQPDAKGQLAYYVQIDPSLLQTLAAGDEIHAAIDPDAGRVGQFVVLSGNKQLPRVGTQPAPAPKPESTLQPPPLATVGGKNSRFPMGADQPAFAPAGTAPIATDDSLYPRSPSRFGPNQPTGATGDLRSPAFDTAPATGYQPLGPVLNAPAGYGTAPPTQPGNQYANNEVLAPPGNTYGDSRYGDNRYPDNRFADSRFSDRGALQPPAEPYATQPYANQPGYVQRTGAEQPQAQPRGGGFTASTGYTPQPALQDNRVASVTRETAGGAAPLTGPLAAPQVAPVTGGKATAEEKPWMPLMFTAFALFLSIGGNLYLGWTAAEFYSRYRLATERLRSAGRP